MMILDVYGHISIICIGIPVVSGVAYNLREMKIQRLLLKSSDKTNNEIDALTYIGSIQQIIKTFTTKKTENVTLIGIINLHVLECVNQECSCKNENELYDAKTGKYSKRDVGYHRDEIFLKYFNKQLYENALKQFISSPLLHINYSSYLFDIMKNVHASISELDLAIKKKPTLQQLFTIYRRRNAIEEYIRSNDSYEENDFDCLVNVIEFEEILSEFQKKIESIANLQVEFWAQVTNQLPDLNILQDFVNKIYTNTNEVEELWKKLSQINNNCSKSLTLYGNYLFELKNHRRLASELFER